MDPSNVPSDEEDIVDPEERLTKDQDIICPICLDILKDAVNLPLCLHTFCLKCLWSWAELSRRCPLCKGAFEYVMDTSTGIRINLIESIHETTNGVQRYSNAHSGPPRTRQGEFGRRLSETRAILERERNLQRRRHIYSSNLWAVSHPSDARPKFHDTMPQTFARNPVRCRQQLAPWIKRDLQVLLPENEDSELVIEYILALMQDQDLASENGIRLLEGFLGSHARHFVHELFTFALSPLGIEAYDQAVSYTSRPP